MSRLTTHTTLSHHSQLLNFQVAIYYCYKRYTHTRNPDVLEDPYQSRLNPHKGVPDFYSENVAQCLDDAPNKWLTAQYRHQTSHLYNSSNQHSTKFSGIFDADKEEGSGV
eukprot:GHVN01000286.1.p2 GENE.GHVN01000286.1~~GHVN01000286.1.p2  ORF type:complete len:110 (+),score=17.83 GHVN01000286.1:190-519(+)